MVCVRGKQHLCSPSAPVYRQNTRKFNPTPKEASLNIGTPPLPEAERNQEGQGFRSWQEFDRFSQLSRLHFISIMTGVNFFQQLAHTGFSEDVQVGAHGPLVIFSCTSEQWLESRECFLLCYLQRARVMQRPKFQHSPVTVSYTGIIVERKIASKQKHFKGWFEVL